jgi:alpha-galactosidase
MPLLKLIALILLGCVVTPLPAQECATQTMIVATKLRTPLDAAGFPTQAAWSNAAAPVTFCADWQGRNPDPQRQTEVRMLWSAHALYLQFRARYRTLYTYPGGPQRRDQLWDRDVAEVFLQNDAQSDRNYSEIETSPNGDWIDLAISAAGHTDLQSGMHARVTVDAAAKIWTAEVALPMQALTASFDPKRPWRVNFFRVEGPEPNRFYSSWKPTNTERPNFHVPEAFGTLKFSD